MYDRLTHAPLQTIHAENFTILTGGGCRGETGRPHADPPLVHTPVGLYSTDDISICEWLFLLANIENVGITVRELE